MDRLFRIPATLLFCFALVSSATAEGLRRTQDPNHQGWVTVKNQVPNYSPVFWKDVKTGCKACKELAWQYNRVMDRLMSSRYDLKDITSRHTENLIKAAKKWDKVKSNIKKRGGSKKEVQRRLDEVEAEAVELVSKYGATYDAYAAALKVEIVRLAALGNSLRQSLKDCEKICAPKAEKAKSVNKTGERSGQGTGQNAGSGKPSADLVLPFDWKGPYPEVCFRCAKLAQRLNLLPRLARERLAEIARLQAEIATDTAKIKLIRNSGFFDSSSRVELVDRRVASLEFHITTNKILIEKLQADLKKIKANFDATLKLYNDCIKTCKKGQKQAALIAPDRNILQPASACPAPAAHLAAVVGANEKVGSGARLKNKVREAFGGGFGVGGSGGSSIGGGFGQGRSTFGGGGGRPALGPKPDLDDDPIDDDDKVTQEVQDVELATGALWTDEGLLVSVSIEDAPGDGTFQSIFLEDDAGRRRAPDEIRLYGMWHDWQLTVTWTYREWVDNELVREESGGWSEEGRNAYVSSSLTEGVAQDAGLWKLMGFETANKGMRSIGALFRIKPEDLANPMDVVVHTTLPEESPVTTVPIANRLSRENPEDDGNLNILVQPTPTTIAQEHDCY